MKTRIVAVVNAWAQSRLGAATTAWIDARIERAARAAGTRIYEQFTAELDDASSRVRESMRMLGFNW